MDTAKNLDQADRIAKALYALLPLEGVTISREETSIIRNALWDAAKDSGIFFEVAARYAMSSSL